jgi:hypothetical protein
MQELERAPRPARFCSAPPLLGFRLSQARAFFSAPTTLGGKSPLGVAPMPRRKSIKLDGHLPYRWRKPVYLTLGLELEHSTQSGIAVLIALGLPRHRGGGAVLIYLFRDDRTANLALTTDVTGGNLPAVTPATNWGFVETIDTIKSSPPWDFSDFQRLLGWLRADGFYLFEAGVRDVRNLPTGWARLRK